MKYSDKQVEHYREQWDPQGVHLSRLETIERMESAGIEPERAPCRLNEEDRQLCESGVIMANDFLRESDNDSVPDNEKISMADSTVECMLGIFRRLSGKGE